MIGGVNRTTWTNRVWNNTYGQYVYSDPTLPGSYYLSTTDNLSYPITLLQASQGAANVVPVQGNGAVVIELKVLNPR